MALSPDGTRIVFVSQDQDGVPRFFHRRLDQPNAVVLPGTEGGKQPFFSPDGQWVGFFAAGKLKKTRINGGEPVSLCDAPSGRGASWGQDGNIIAALSPGVGLSQVPSGGGNPVSLTELGPGEACHRWPYVLPGGKFVLFTVSRVINNFEEADIALLTLQGRGRRTLLEHAGMYPRYLPSGHLVYVTKGSLFAAPFDLKRFQITGAATRLEEVASDIPIGFAQVDFSAAGICVFGARGQGLSIPQWLDAVGRTEPLGLEPARYHHLRLSPDGARLAYVSTQGPNSDLFIYDWQRGIRTRLTNGLVTSYPVWSPDGRFVVFAGLGGMFAVQTDGGAIPAQLTRSNNRQVPETFSPDGRLVFMETIQRGQGGDACLACGTRERPTAGWGAPAAFQDSAHNDITLLLSGRTMAGLFECGKRGLRSLRPGIFGQQQTGAGLERRRNHAALVAERTGTLLSHGRPADYGGELCGEGGCVHSPEAPSMVRQADCERR